jgi:hypothetical protein
MVNRNDTKTSGGDAPASPSHAPTFHFGAGSSDSLPPAALSNAAFHGLVGEIIRVIEPHTEADNAALVLSLLTQFGNVIGRSPYYLVERTEHHTNLFLGLVGPTSAGRKGTAQRVISSLFQKIDPDWFENGWKSGLSSGEGVIQCVSDQRESDTNSVMIDKRVLIVEEELVSALKTMERQGKASAGPRLSCVWSGTI